MFYVVHLHPLPLEKNSVANVQCSFVEHQKQNNLRTKSSLKFGYFVRMFFGRLTVNNIWTTTVDEEQSNVKVGFFKLNRTTGKHHSVIVNSFFVCKIYPEIVYMNFLFWVFFLLKKRKENKSENNCAFLTVREKERD